MTDSPKYRIFSGNALKIIAALTMLIDHIGVILLPQYTLLRIIGRLSFPLYAFMIAEGCHHTRSKLRYFLSVLVLGVACQLVYGLWGGDDKWNVLITLALSMLPVFALQYWKKTIYDEKRSNRRQALGALLLAGAFLLLLLLNLAVDITYQLFGCLLPFFASLLMPVREMPPQVAARLQHPALPMLTTAIGLVPLCMNYGGIQFFSLLSLPLLLLYSGRRGKWRMKYFFYLFYPLHLALLQGIALLIAYLSVRR